MYLQVQNLKGFFPLHSICVLGADVAAEDMAAVIKLHPAAVSHTSVMSGDLPLHLALRMGKVNAEVVEMLMIIRCQIQ